MNKSLLGTSNHTDVEIELKIPNGEKPRARNVHVSIEFLRLGEIDTIGEKFYAEVMIKSTWIENNSLTTYNSQLHWNPNLYIENALLEPKQEISYFISKFYDMTRVREIRFAKGYFWERLELENFPLDTQELSVVVSSKLTNNQIEILQDPDSPSFIDFKASRIFVDQQKWNLFKFVSVGYVASYDLPNPRDSKADQNYVIYQNKTIKVHPKFVATCFVARKPGYYVFNAYFIIFLITILSLTTFSINCKLPQARLQTSFTLVLTSASFKWVINRSLPTISYMTSLDKYAIVCIFYLCIICIWHSIIGTVWEDLIFAARLDYWVLIVFLVIFLFIHIVFSFWLFKCYNNIRSLHKMNDKYINELKENSSID
jgi:hypothetical protein